MKRTFILLGVVCCGVLALGSFYVYRSIAQFLGRGQMPGELEQARVFTGADQFAKDVLYSERGLGMVTDITVSNHDIAVAGQDGAVFLKPDGSRTKSVRFAGCQSDTVLIDLGDGNPAFLCRGSWSQEIRVWDDTGKTLWTYGGDTGVDDAAVGDLGTGGRNVVVGFNGSGGIHLLDSKGKKIWQRPDGNVWHVEIVARDGQPGKVILHSNARGQIVIRNADGDILAQHTLEFYLARFSVTAWGSDPRRNKLVAADAGWNYVLSMDGDTIARLPRRNIGIADPKGTPWKVSETTVDYATLEHNRTWRRSLLRIYDPQNRLVYDEVLSDDCSALTAAPDGNHAEALLLGCNGAVFRYRSH